MVAIKMLGKWPSAVFNVNFEQISHLFLVFLLLTLNKYLLAGYYVRRTNPEYVSVTEKVLTWSFTTYVFKISLDKLILLKLKVAVQYKI